MTKFEESSVLLNADLGEGATSDSELFKLVDLANIACGGHAGDEHSMRLCCELALEQGVRVGPHPSYPDREGFGRRKPDGPVHNLYGELMRQVDSFLEIAALSNCPVTHLKAHGQLYNDAAFDPVLGELMLKLSLHYGNLKLLVLANSPLEIQALNAGVNILREGFPDRAYWGDGALVERSMLGAVLHDSFQVASQAKAMALGEPISSLDGEWLAFTVDTLCLHGDNPQALANARAVRAMVPRAGNPER